MKISVVIGTYNQRDILKMALESLFHQSLSPELYEILVVDSWSSDGTDRMIEELRPTCRFTYRRVVNKGKAFARNVGIRNAQSEIIVLTDADMIADTGLLEKHLHAHKKKKNAAFEGLTINPDNKPYITARLRPFQRLKWAYFLSGNLSIKRKTLMEAGLFDENFKNYGWEDIELGYRLAQMRIPLYYLPSAINLHRHPVSEAGLVERKFLMGQSAALFYRKHPYYWVKIFLGLNPLAMAIFHFIKRHPNILDLVRRRAGSSKFYRYLLAEYQYRLGLEEGLSKY